MKRIHIALATQDIEASIEDYSVRLGANPNVVIAGEYALWRTQWINLSLRQDNNAPPGVLRHLGWEDTETSEFSSDTDCNGVVWERFTAKQQAEEIEALWPGSGYMLEDDDSR